MTARQERKAHKDYLRNEVIAIYQRAYETNEHNAQKAIEHGDALINDLIKQKPQEKAHYTEFADDARATLKAMLPKPVKVSVDPKQLKTDRRQSKGRHKLVK